ncbi:ABC transporter permease [Rhodobium gokarnense]|uniref:Peptide/nickel transport system permease protein n=1 Tax=Rhodobium gokarnense TaxID=364296 RepID=A0ABT3H7Z3_9HYPH|nr:ABC transporter permease [Rhodobium gokarnense]MCW2306501.1 peptide/nickel transport system permease protein [Rhodobium gokarnense]
MTEIGSLEILIGVLFRFWPVWACLAAILGTSFYFRGRLGLYGHLFDSGVGFVGLMLVLFWLLTALFADVVATFPPLEQFALLKRAVPGTVEAETGIPFYFGADNLGRDLFSRMVHGSRFVLAIAPAATFVAYVVGITLGLPAGYFGGRIDAVLSFIANLVLAFPVIVLFYLLVTPGVRETAIPVFMAGLFFIFPILFLGILFHSRYAARPQIFWSLMAVTLVVGGWIYAGLVFDADPLGVFSLAPNELNIFAAVVFASSPGVFRIVRGLTMDIRTRDYVAAAQTRGERPAYIMLWEILPNARGPLIVDACLRVGYTTILLGTLGFFGLGLAPESPDWGSMINQTRGFIRIVPTIVLPQTIAIATLVLGLNLLADGLREQSLKD